MQDYILSKNKKYPDNTFHDRVNTDEYFIAVQFMFGNIDHLAMWQGRPSWNLVSMMNGAKL